MIDGIMRIIEDERMPKDSILILNPRFKEDGTLDVDRTAKASRLITNIGMEEEDEEDY